MDDSPRRRVRWSAGGVDPLLTRDLTGAGYSHDELARMGRTGELVHLRRGAWLAGVPEDDADRHRLLISATSALTGDGVVSHVSAAVLHGLPTFGPLDRVHLTRPDGRGKRRGHVHRHVAPLGTGEAVEHGGLAVTGLARTVVDLARVLPFHEAVATADAALRLGLERPALDEALGRASRRPGVGAARRAVAFADGRSESVGESFSRVTLHRCGLARTELQLEVAGPDGCLVGSCDFGWSAARTLGEFDGRAKYGLEGDAADALWREKRREDRVRALGYEVVRVVWADLARPDLVRQRVLAAFQRAGARPRGAS